MKNKLILIPMISLVFVGLTGCTSKKTSLTFGTHIQQSLDSLKPIESSTLLDKSYSDEVYLLATYQGQYSKDCLCWSTFQNVIVNYTNKYHEKVYLYDMDSYNKMEMNLGLDIYKDSTPALYIYQGREQLAKFSYKEERDNAIFAELDAEAMYTRVHNYVEKPVIYEVDDAYLSENLSSKDEVITMFVRRSCTDCSYSLNKVLIPYINKKDINKEIWYFDLEDYYLLSKDQNATSAEQSSYQQIKDKYGLSESNGGSLGYSSGFVPTTQYYKNGVLKDASVFFNDEVSKKEDGSYYISNSFYTSERLTSLSYCKHVKNNVLKGMNLGSDEVATTASGYTYWIQAKAAVYHTPLLEAFLNYYCK